MHCRQASEHQMIVHLTDSGKILVQEILSLLCVDANHVYIQLIVVRHTSRMTKADAFSNLKPLSICIHHLLMIHGNIYFESKKRLQNYIFCRQKELF